MASMSASSPDVCGTDVQSLYLEDPGNKAEPVGYVLCTEMGNTCMKNGCSCRSASSAVVNGTTKYFGVCVVLTKGADCVTSGDDYITCATGSGSSVAESTTTPESQNEASRSDTATSQTTKASAESKRTPSASASASGSAKEDSGKVSSTAASSSSMSTTVMIVIIVVAVVFVALVSWVIRAYCMRRSAAQSKLASRRNRSSRANRSTNLDATSPTNMTGRSSATPSFPAFDRRTRAMQSPTSTGSRGTNALRPGNPRDANAPRGRGDQDMPRGRNTPRGPGMNREPTSGRGRRNPDIEFGPTDGGRGRGDAGMRREPTSGRGRRNPDMPFGPGMQREPNSGRGRKNPDVQQRGNVPREQRPKPPARPPANNAAAPSGGTVYTGRNTYERVAQFAQLAAFEAPPPPPPRPQRPIQPVPVTDPVPKHARAPPPVKANAARPAPKPQGFYIPEDASAMDYDILSPKTARSLAPSVASSATTVVAPGRNRPTPLQQGRRPQYSNAPPSYYKSTASREDSRYDESRYDESKYGESKYDESSFESKFKASSNYDDSFVSEVSSMAWSGASGLSDDSYYHAAASNTARIPVIDAPHDDDDDRSEDGYSDWGHSTQQSSDAFRSTAASDASFFSVNSDFTDTGSVFKEREF
ncbi:unnamed protein product [Phytophthora lilii]|uniref:Unnamed protein product n=1 Tax=Phytophthora lilii TaxID=2077276 RepID=A0A9W6X4F3_9STRA|nr:unnamed protein product [Phytophthora lilii]